MFSLVVLLLKVQGQDDTWVSGSDSFCLTDATFTVRLPVDVLRKKMETDTQSEIKTDKETQREKQKHKEKTIPPPPPPSTEMTSTCHHNQPVFKFFNIPTLNRWGSYPVVVYTFKISTCSWAVVAHAFNPSTWQRQADF